MATLDVYHSSPAEKLINEFAVRGMTTEELAESLYTTGKFERCLLQSKIKSPGNSVLKYISFLFLWETFSF